MAHHKRGRRKNARAGCRHCHREKANGQKLRLRVRACDLRRLDAADEQIRENTTAVRSTAPDDQEDER